MSMMLSKTQDAIAWVNTTRQHAVRLDDEADALLTQLHMAAATESAINAASQQGSCIGLYGHSQSAKAYLLNALCGSDSKLNIITPGRSFDYFSHLNPGHAPTNMALRFTRKHSEPDDEWPLRLRLISEAELVQIFIAYACGQSGHRGVDKSIIEARLAQWQSLRQRQPVQGVTASEVAAIARFWRACVPSSQQHIDDALWQQFATLLPAVDLSTRASAWSLLWGELPELTRQWQKLAHLLQQTGHASELAAPLSLLVDQFGLPAESFITQEALAQLDGQSDVVVHPLVNQQLHNAIGLPLDSLALLTRELVLTVENAVLDNVDVLDIPLAPDVPPSPLWQAKLGWMLEHYRQQCQPDILMICNATATRAETPAAARRLLAWINETQPLRDAALPGVVWAITPQDARFITQLNLDETVQQLTGKPGLHWGTLQALDKHSLQRLVEWLSQATSPLQHQARLSALRDRHQHHLRALFSWQSGETVSAENVVRQLQGQAARHGDLLEGLLPPARHFDALLRIQHPREEQVNGLFNDAIDLFSDERDAPPQIENKETGYLVHKMWLNHVRQWCRNDSHAQRLGLEPDTLRAVVDILIVTSYRLNLPQQLQQIAQREDVCGAQLYAAVANFIGWLGYADTDEAERPASRIQKGTAIFSAVKRQPMARLSRLGEQPAHAASRYVYDWLVALYTRANENKGYRHPQEVTDADKKALRDLLAG
ncbi:virulence effector SrfC [Citrobacter amalonaticus]|uniref:Virulence effector SrfC n=1 Tax=Citrobacter amalonaticus TaxID=35703 RepID=A0A2S4S130_CITAM|nr:virulence factor SrfC family protein [Citrobacter amalonaticus]POT55275.1 virulence effector SrfC [Citrobacter amalonaticus]POT77117.1 virulence effector SrfC [Citrobacter amalonaticus]POU67568.1 virulence effector SrfC [Citrobacter amalonaticus]POV07173.1 virulence effector SrfC [Citrobacter amalonaticus]